LILTSDILTLYNKFLESKRRPNFSEAEKEALVDGVADNYDALVGKFSAKLSGQRKDELWKEILAKVNVVNHITLTRSLDEIKKKFQGLKKDVKAKESSNRREINKTGGGMANIVSHDRLGQRILQCIPEVVIGGILGGVDTSSE